MWLNGCKARRPCPEFQPELKKCLKFSQLVCVSSKLQIGKKYWKLNIIFHRAITRKAVYWGWLWQARQNRRACHIYAENMPSKAFCRGRWFSVELMSLWKVLFERNKMFQRDVVRIISACCPTLLFRDDGKAANGIPDEDKISRPPKKKKMITQCCT